MNSLFRVIKSNEIISRYIVWINYICLTWNFSIVNVLLNSGYRLFRRATVKIAFFLKWIVCHHLLNYNYLPSFEDFSVLFQKNKNCLFEKKEGLFIMTDKPSTNRKILATHPFVWMSFCHICCTLCRSVISSCCCNFT